MKPPKIKSKPKNYYIVNEKFRPKPPSESQRCHHITKIGKRCKKPARIGNICLSHYLLKLNKKKK